MKFLKTFKSTFVLCIVLFTFSAVSAQNKTKTIQPSLSPKKQVSEKYKKAFEKVAKETNTSELRRIELQYRMEHTAIKSNVKSYALLHNIQTRVVQDNKTMELQRVLEDGTLIYFETYNDDAAISTRTDYLNTGGGLGLALNGDGLTANVWDGGHGRITHNEYDGTGGNNRLTLIDTGSEGGTQLNFHAAHVSGTIMSSGQGGDASSKGMAWQANARGAMWNNDIAEATSEAANNMLVSNHSYGFGATGIPDEWFGAYLTESEAWDNIMHNAPYYLMVVAAGNDGANNTANDSPLSGNASYDKLSGHAVSKNNLVVANGRDANINGDGSLNSATRNGGSSEGPSDDFRIKPDIMGNGTNLNSTSHTADNSYQVLNGTSMASPNVAGTLLLLQEHYANLNASSFMRAATLKGLALHTADDIEPSNTNNAETVSLIGPDATTGWGLLNAKKAAETLTTAAANSGSALVEELTLSQGQSYQIMVQSNGTDPLQASISWTDPEGTGFAMTVDGSGNPPFSANANNPTLVNDLDILVEQGATDYFPWRMTGVNTNGTGNNSADPYERVDVAGASGTYTITITHKGTLTQGPQNYSLIVTGIVVATAPEISFSILNDTEDENSDCGFTVVTVPLTIAQAPSVAADVNFTINGSSTATPGVDFDLMTPSVTFGTSGTSPENMILHVYHDDFVEGAETVDIDFTVNANSGDAIANTNADSFTLTINDDDSTPLPTENVALFSDGFETYSDFNITNVGGWTMLDNDGNTTYGSPTVDWTNESYTGTFIVFNPSQTNPSLVGSAFDTHTGNKGYYCFDATNNPNGTAQNDDYIFTPQISLTGTGSELNFWAKSVTDQYGLERFRVGISTTNTNPGSFTFIQSGSFEEAPTAWTEYTYDLSAYDGMDIYVTIHVVSLDAFAFMLDDISVTADVSVGVQTTVNTGTPDLINSRGAGTSYAEDASTGDIMAQIINNSTDNYECVTVAVDRAGTGAQGYNGSTGANRVMDKRFSMSPVNSVSSGSVTSTFYFTPAEINGWEAVTGRDSNELVIARESSGVIEETVAVTEGTFGSNITLSGTFSGISDTYYFGPIEAFVSPCSGILKTWTAGGWSPSGAPTVNDMVEIDDSSYNWALGDIVACTLKINNGVIFTIPGGNFVNIDGNIIVDGSLVIAHQGSLVQTNPSAEVIKNGTITVNVETPTLQTRDFMIMGSPMTDETRDAVWNTPFLVLGFTPENFMPHDDVPAGGTNWADDNGDFYNTITGSTDINPGEGYIVRPQDSYTDPANESYIFNYSQGTLNNGNVVYVAENNGPVDNPSGTPNVVANPYPSAIDSDIFMTANGLTALYFWEHLTPPGTGLPGSNMRFDMEDISIRNMGMGMPAGNDTGNVMGTSPNNVISTAQGFGVRTNGADGTTQNITFTNTMRLTSGNTTLRRPSGETESILLEVRNAAFQVGGFAGLAFTENATAQFDAGYDTNRLATVTSLYSHLEDGSEQLGIQSREAFTSEMEIPFGFATQATEALDYTISLNTVTGENVSEVEVYLYDSLLDIETKLTETTYTFTANEGVQDNRFVVYFEPRMVLGTSEVALSGIKLYPNPTSDVITISSPRILITDVILRDIQGRIVFVSSSEENNSYQVDLSGIEASVYFAEIVTVEGTITKRIIKK